MYPSLLRHRRRGGGGRRDLHEIDSLGVLETLRRSRRSTRLHKSELAADPVLNSGAERADPSFGVKSSKRSRKVVGSLHQRLAFVKHYPTNSIARVQPGLSTRAARPTTLSSQRDGLRPKLASPAREVGSGATAVLDPSSSPTTPGTVCPAIASSIAAVADTI